MYLTKPYVSYYFNGKICLAVQKVCVSVNHRDTLERWDAAAMEAYNEIEYYNKGKPPVLLISSNCLASNSKWYDSEIRCGATQEVLMASYTLGSSLYFESAGEGLQFAREHIHSILAGVN